MKTIEIKLQLPELNATLEFNPNIYAIDVIKRAAYKFTDRCAFEFEYVDELKVILNITFLAIANDETQKDIINQLHNEILDQDLRRIVSAETEQVRNLILANAFSNTKLINPEAS